MTCVNVEDVTALPLKVVNEMKQCDGMTSVIQLCVIDKPEVVCSFALKLLLR